MILRKLANIDFRFLHVCLKYIKFSFQNFENGREDKNGRSTGIFREHCFGTLKKLGHFLSLWGMYKNEN